MLDREGYRPNVGIILLNARNEVFWGKRIREHSWQFPQGGIKYGETPLQAMYRELREETGLAPEHVRIIGRTRDWLRYEVPDRFIRREVRGHYRGQKQIWFLLRMVGRDCDISLRATRHPEFDAWRWHDYWIPLEAVIEFKRDVYQLALTELSRFLRPAAPLELEGLDDVEAGAVVDGMDVVDVVVPGSPDDTDDVDAAGSASGMNGDAGSPGRPPASLAGAGETVRKAKRPPLCAAGATNVTSAGGRVAATAGTQLATPRTPAPASEDESPLLAPLEVGQGSERGP